MLLSSQPDILIVDAVADTCEVPSLLQPSQPTTVLVEDVLSPQPDLAQQLRTIAPEAGLLFLVQSYELLDTLANVVAHFELLGILGVSSPDVDTVLSCEEVSP